MRLTAANKEKIRLRIIAGAARLFREHGYDDVSLDQVMETAGLTRGAFYAHFTSKAELFAEVARTEHPLLRMLQGRDGRTADELWTQALAIFANYLAPENLEKVYAGCTLASLTGEVSRAPEPVKHAYELAWRDICSELTRGQTAILDEGAIESALVLAVGAVTTAAACADCADRVRILDAARAGFEALTSTARSPSEIEQPKQGA